MNYEELIANMDDKFKTKIKFGDNRSLEVATKGVIEVDT